MKKAVSVALVPYGILPTAKHNICPNTTHHSHNIHRNVMTVIITMQPIQIKKKTDSFFKNSTKP